MEYYKFYNKSRFGTIRKRKIYEHSSNIRNGYNLAFAIVLLFIMALPYSQFALADIHQDVLFKLRQCIIFNISSAIVCLIYHWAAKKIIPKYDVDDDEKRFRFISNNQIAIFIVSAIMLAIMITIFFLFDKFLPYNNLEIYTMYNSDVDFKVMGHSRYFVNQFVMSVFLICAISCFTLTFFSLEARLNRKMKTNVTENEVYIYWLSFIKALLLENPVIVLSAVLFILLTMASFIVRGNYVIASKHFILSVAFYSFWFTSLTAIITPFFTKIRILNTTFHNYSIHKLKNSIVAGLKDHVIIIGTGNLGRLLVNNTFIDIHPEGYESHSLCPKVDHHCGSTINDVSDYDFIITKDLQLQMVSRRMVVIEKQDRHFDAVYDNKVDLKIGTYNLWPRSDLNIVLPGIIGDAHKNLVLYEARSDMSQIIVNTTPDSVLSMKLSADYPAKKLILSVSNSNSFDVLTATTYDKSVYTIDVQQIEGAVLSQVIYSWAISNIRNNLESAFREKSNFDSKINDKYLNRKKQDPQLANYYFFVSLLQLKKDGKVLIAGNGSYIYYIIQSLWLTMKFSLELPNEFIKNVIENKIIVLTEDIRIKDEIRMLSDIEEDKGRETEKRDEKKLKPYWSFYPIRNKNTWSTINGYRLNLLTFSKAIKNFDSYVEIFSMQKPELVVLMNDMPYEAVEMFTEAANSAEAVKRFNKNFKMPQVMVYSVRTDKIYLMELFKKYDAYNRKLNNIYSCHGFPSQNIKESRISRDYISASQFASMLRSLYTNLHLPENDGVDEPIAEVTFSILEKPGALAYTVAKLCGLELRIEQKHYKIPSFIYYYSAEMSRYRDTFIFRGTAKLEQNSTNIFLEDSIRYCFVNCDNKFREDMEDTIINNLGYMADEVDVNKTITEDIGNIPDDAGMFTNYPISTLLRHPNKYNSILNNKRRLFVNKIPKMPEPEKKHIPFNKLSIGEKLGMFNLADFTIWADGEEIPGSYASVLAQLIFGNVSESQEHFSKGNWVPQILFSNNRPSNKLESEISYAIAQDSFYIKLTQKSQRDFLAANLIRAAKVKLSYNINSKNRDWIDYTKNLREHLYKMNSSYSVFSIEKINLEGTNYEGNEGLINISFYKKLDCTDSALPEENFQIVTKWVEDADRLKDLPEIRFDLKREQYEIRSDWYELALIRDDILQNSVNETMNGKKFGHFQNMLFQIDEL